MEYMEFSFWSDLRRQGIGCTTDIDAINLLNYQTMTLFCVSLAGVITLVQNLLTCSRREALNSILSLIQITVRL